jgi:small conductance mechanosensitive channel
MDELLQEAFANANEQFQEMLGDVIAYSPRLLIGIIVGIVAYLIARQIRRTAIGFTERVNAPQAAEQLIVNVVFISALLAATVTTLAAFGVNVASLVAGLGLGGLIVGFALKDTIENLAAGTLLLIKRPFEIGHLIEVSDELGHVMEVSIRATKLKTLDNLEVIIPNRMVYSNVVTNYSAYAVRRREVTLGFGYGVDLLPAVQTIIKRLEGVEGVVDVPAPTFAMNDLGASTVDGTLYYHINTAQDDFAEVHNRVIAAVRDVADEQGIDLPYQTITVLNGNSA